MKIYEANITHVDEVTELLLISGQWTGLDLPKSDVIRALAVSSSLYLMDVPMKGVIGVQKYFPYNHVISVFGSIGKQKYEIAESLLSYIIKTVDDLDGIYIGKKPKAKKFLVEQGFIKDKIYEDQIFYRYSNGHNHLTADLKKR